MVRPIATGVPERGGPGFRRNRVTEIGGSSDASRRWNSHRIRRPQAPAAKSCPICGRTGEYAGLKGNLVELVHDPLGLELLLTGKIRGETVKFWDWEGRDIGSVAWLTQKFSVFQVMFPAQAEDKNTLRIGIVVLTAK